VGLKLIFLIVPRAVSVLGLSRRESWWKDAEILMLRHQLAVAQRERPRAHSCLTPDRAWLALLAGTLPVEVHVQIADRTTGDRNLAVDIPGGADGAHRCMALLPGVTADRGLLLIIGAVHQAVDAVSSVVRP
jgi:hypothetical protein